MTGPSRSPRAGPLLTLARQHPVVAVLRAPHGAHLVSVGQALSAGGIRMLELTTTTPGALRALTMLRDSLPEKVALGMGTVMTADQVRAAAAAGADFVVSPAVCPNLPSAAADAGMAAVLAGWTPTEVAAAWEAGPAMVKVFPAGGHGIEHVAALHDIYPDVPLLPTGGIATDTAASYLRAGAVAVGIGGSLLRDALAGRDDLDRLTRTVAELITSLHRPGPEGRRP